MICNPVNIKLQKQTLAEKRTVNPYFPCRCYVGDRDSNEWRPCHSSMANDRVFFDPKVSRRKSSDEEPTLYDSDPDESMRAPDVIRPPPPVPTASARTEQHFEQSEVMAKVANVTKITAIKFGFT